MRLFVALELAEEVARALTAVQQQMQASGRPPVKWVAPTGMHLTLKFLGEVDSERVPAIRAALNAVVRSRRAVAELRLAGVGAFPNLRRPQTLWVGVEGDISSLMQLQQGIEQALVPLGFEPEGRPFRAHLTLGRVRQDATPEQRASLGTVIARLPAPPPVRWAPGSPILFQSTLTPSGAIYTRIPYGED